MSEMQDDKPIRRILVIMPKLLGEAVMATAVLHALRENHPDAHISVLLKRKLRPVLWGLDSVDRVLSIRKRRANGMVGRKRRGRASVVRLGRRLSRGDFDTAVILPNTLKSAAIAAVAGIPRRVGYEVEGRGVLLTDRLVPRRHRGEDIAVPALDRYLGIARYLGAHHPSAQMFQRVRPEDQLRLTEYLTQAGIDPVADELMLVNPGAPTEARRWSPRRMAHLCELMSEYYGVKAVVTGTPAERGVVKQMLERVTVPIFDLPELGRDLHLLKAMVARSRMMVTNDAGPRYLAAAMGTPLLTLFGPTSPEGASSSFEHERRVVAEGLSIAARDDPDFAGRASLDCLHTDKVFDHACTLYERTRALRVGADA